MRQYFSLQPPKKDEIALSFHKQYTRCQEDGLSPDEIYGALQRFAGGEAVPSVKRQSAVLAVLAFFFEECDIFEHDDLSGGVI